MKIRIVGSGPLYDQAKRLADAAGYELVTEGEDYILPATENEDVLKGLAGPKVLFDADAWAICSSRLRTDALLREKGIPAPEYFPGGSEPYIVKPDRGSFGLGIWVTDDYCEVGGAVNAGFVTQEELPGDVWSAAVYGRPGDYTAAVARLTYDDRRQRVAAEYVELPEKPNLLHQTVKAVAEAVQARGVLEVEVMLHQGEWKVVDVNARLPMLTSDALLAQGVNLLEELIKVQ